MLLYSGLPIIQIFNTFIVLRLQNQSIKILDFGVLKFPCGHKSFKHEFCTLLKEKNLKIKRAERHYHS